MELMGLAGGLYQIGRLVDALDNIHFSQYRLVDIVWMFM